MPSLREDGILCFRSMKPIRSVSFIKSATKIDQCPRHDLPEIAFIGRSNVGKSSLLNSLVNKKNLARISNTPGRTQCINFFKIEENFCFVDLPGYGFAKVPDHIRAQWKPMIEGYLLQRDLLCRVILIIDARHAPTRQDVLMWNWLHAYQRTVLLVVTKIDKIPKNQRPKQTALIRETLNLTPEYPLFLFSAITGEGVKPLWHAIFEAIASPLPTAELMSPRTVTALPDEIE